MILVAGIFAGLAVCVLVWILRDLPRCGLALEPDPDVGDDHGRVTVVVPMRDEAGNVDRCLSALRAQTYRNLEVVVCDDGSVDGTGERLRRWREVWPELIVLAIEELPAGWTGKANAVHRGVQLASGDWLLLIDADVELAPDAVARTLATVVVRDWPVLSLVGRLLFGSPAERLLLLPHWVLLYVAWTQLPGMFLVGHFTLLRRSAYDAVGGFAAIAGAVSTDIALAALLADHGIRPRLQIWPGAFRCRMYASPVALWHGLGRMLAAANRFRASRVAALAAAFAAAVVLPEAVVVLWLAGLLSAGVPGVLAISATVLVAAQWLATVLVAGRLAAPLSLTALKPVADLGLLALLLDTARRLLTGGITWRGRRYRGPSPAITGAPIVPVSGLEATGPASPRLTVVVTGGDGDGARLALPPSLAAAAEDPGVEVLLVGDLPPEPPEGTGATTTVRRLVAPGTSRWRRRRRGLEAARGWLVAFAAAELEYCEGWTGAIEAAFAGEDLQLAAGPVRFTGDGPRERALTIHRWGHLAGAEIPYPEADNLAGRRETLRRLVVDDAPVREEGELVLGVLAGAAGLKIRRLPEMLAAAPAPARGPGVPAALLAGRLAAPGATLGRALATLDHRPLLLVAVRRLLPLLVAADSARLSLGGLRRLRGVRRAPGGPLGVALWLARVSALDLTLAVGGAVSPDWLERRAGIPPADVAGFVLGPERLWGVALRMVLAPRWRHANPDHS